LPTVLTVPFYYHEILENAESYFKEMNFKRKKKDRYLETYFDMLAHTFVTLKDNL